MGFDVKLLASTVDNLASRWAGSTETCLRWPHLRARYPLLYQRTAGNIFDALIEDQSQGSVLQSRRACGDLFDSPSPGRVDGIFNEVNFFGPFDIDLIVDGNIVKQARRNHSFAQVS